MVLKERGPPTQEGWYAHRICGVSHREDTEGKLDGRKPGIRLAGKAGTPRSCGRREAGKTAGIAGDIKGFERKSGHIHLVKKVRDSGRV